jgi:hypothetical protein
MDIAFWFFGALLLLGLMSLIVLWQDRLIYFPLRYSTAQLRGAGWGVGRWVSRLLMTYLVL